MSKEDRKMRRERIKLRVSNLKQRIKDSALVQGLKGLDFEDLAALEAVRAYVSKALADNKITLAELTEIINLLTDLRDEIQDKDGEK